MIYARLDEKDKWEDKKRNHILPNNEVSILHELIEQLDPPIEEEIEEEEEPDTSNIITLKPTKRGFRS